MNLVELSVAAVLFSAASGSSLQLWAQAASRSQQTELQQQLLERIDLDRLHLQATWRQSGNGCGVDPAALLAQAAAVPVPPQLQRTVQLSADGLQVQVRWQALAAPALQRQRLFTPAGLGLSVCPMEPPLTDSEVEEVQP